MTLVWCVYSPYFLGDRGKCNDEAHVRDSSTPPWSPQAVSSSVFPPKVHHIKSLGKDMSCEREWELHVSSRGHVNASANYTVTWITVIASFTLFTDEMIKFGPSAVTPNYAEIVRNVPGITHDRWFAKQEFDNVTVPMLSKQIITWTHLPELLPDLHSHSHAMSNWAVSQAERETGVC